VTAGPTPTGDPAGRAPPSFLPALTGVRAFAALWVMLLHLTEVTSVLLPERVARGFGLLALPGFLGVDVFFVLSGFIISYNYEARFAGAFDRARYLAFLRARLARIYPVHLVLLVALVALVRGLHVSTGDVEPARWSTGQLIESVLLIQAWVGHAGAWNSVSWSISSEWLAYLLFPAMVRAARAIARGRGLVLVATIATIAALPASWATIQKATTGLPQLLPLQIISEFLVGCVAFQLYRAGRGRAATAYPGWVLIALVTIAAVIYELGAPALWVVPLVPALILGLAYGHGRLTRIFAHPVMVYGGKISFALYMTHYLWLWLMHHFFPLATLVTASLPMRVAWVFAHAAPMPFIAAATYHIIEEPARHWLMRTRAKPAASG